MRRLHLILGIILFTVFLITGQFMRADFPDKEAIDQELLMRSRHIYILFSALIHLALGAYLKLSPRKVGRTFQLIGFFVLLASSVLLVSAFISETYSLQHFSDLSRFGIYTALASVIFHLIGSVTGGNGTP